MTATVKESLTVRLKEAALFVAWWRSGLIPRRPFRFCLGRCFADALLGNGEVVGIEFDPNEVPVSVNTSYARRAAPHCEVQHCVTFTCVCFD